MANTFYSQKLINENHCLQYMSQGANTFPAHNRLPNLNLVVVAIFTFFKGFIDDFSFKNINFGGDFIVIQAFIQSGIFRAMITSDFTGGVRESNLV